jgi:hypothetical protein
VEKKVLIFYSTFVGTTWHGSWGALAQPGVVRSLDSPMVFAAVVEVEPHLLCVFLLKYIIILGSRHLLQLL